MATVEREFAICDICGHEEEIQSDRHINDSIQSFILSYCCAKEKLEEYELNNLLVVLEDEKDSQLSEVDLCPKCARTISDSIKQAILSIKKENQDVANVK